MERSGAQPMRTAFDEPGVCPSLLGRDRQLDALRQTAAGVAAGHGKAMLVAGEAGIGKSRLVRELAARLGQDGWVLLQGNCFERDSVLPYGPVAELLRNTLGSEPPPAIVEQLGPRAVDLARVLPELTACCRRTANRYGPIPSRIGGAFSRLLARSWARPPARRPRC